MFAGLRPAARLLCQASSQIAIDDVHDGSGDDGGAEYYYYYYWCCCYWYYYYYYYYYYYHTCTQHLDPFTTARIPQAKQHRGRWVL